MSPPRFERRPHGTRADMLAALKRRKDAPSKRQELVGWLRKKGKIDEALALAERLQHCRPATRCGSGACPVCQVKQQFRLAQAISRQSQQATDQVFSLTVVSSASAVESGALRSSVHNDQVRRLKRKLQALPVKWLIGGTDYSRNEHREDRYQPFWQPHLQVMGECEDLGEVRAQLKMISFGRSVTVARPSLAKRWDGSRKALFYTMKVDFDRRVGTDEALRLNKETGHWRQCAATTDQRLRSAEKLELLLHLERIGLTARVFSMHCQLHLQGRHYQVRLTT